MVQKMFSRVLLVTLLLVPGVMWGDAQVIDGIAAVVNGDVITFSQVQEVAGPEEQSLRQQYTGQELIDKVKETRLAVLNDLINRQLILQEFKKKDYHLPDYVVEEQVQDIIKDDFGGDRQAFIRTLSAQGYSMNRFRDMQKDKITVQVMRQNMVKGNFTASPEGVDAYYNANKQEFATPAQIKLRMIVLNSDPLVTDSAKTTRQMADEIRDKATHGGDFGTLAKTYSMDGTAENGGDWGWVDEKTLNQDLTKAAFSLSKNQVSPVVQIGDSFYLLYCEDKKDPTITPLNEVRDTIAKKLSQIERQKATQRWIDGLREKAYIKVY
ncbi:MAG: peptidylprolyl isomerase [Verrucomicrobia bacterium]|nr:peptidylprolyl isomerase [Verrucomicrobiota bacterium]